MDRRRSSVGSLVTAEAQPEADPAPPAEVVTGELVPASEAHSARAAEVALHAPPKVLGGLLYATQLAKLSKSIDRTEMVPAAMRGRPDAILAAFMRGHEMGLGPMQSLDSFDVIQGKVALKAEAMRALVMEAGHQIVLEEIASEDGKVTAARADCHRRDWPAEMWKSYIYTLQDAALAGLLSKDSWKKTPRAMLDARATSGACRRYFPDVLAGMSYTPEEVRDFDELNEAPSAPPSPASAAAERSKAPAKKETTPVKAARASKAAAARQQDESEDAPEGLSETLPNGERRVTAPMVRRIMAGFGRLDVTYDRAQRIRYTRNVLRDVEIDSTWDLSVSQAQELLDHLAELNGDAPPHGDAEDRG